MEKVKIIIKKVYMFLFNFIFLIKVKSIGKNCFIGKRAYINKPKYVELGNNVRIGNYARFSIYDRFNDIELNPGLYIGDNVYAGNYLTILVADKVIIEKNVLIASNVMISSENHGMDIESELPYGKQSLITSPVTIREGAWIGENVSILPGVTIGKKAIVATSSVVTKDVPDYTIVGGIPAKILKVYNFEKHVWEKYTERK